MHFNRQTDQQPGPNTGSTTDLDGLISMLYQLVRGEISWSEWLTILLQVIPGDSASLTSTDPVGEVTQLAQSQATEAKTMAYVSAETSLENGTRLTLAVRGAQKTDSPALLKQLMPHIQRVHQLQQSLLDGQSRVAQIAAALTEGLGVGVMLLSGADRQVVHINSVAQEIAEHSGAFRVEQSRLRVLSTHGRIAVNNAMNEVVGRDLRRSKQVRLGVDREICMLFNRLDRCTPNFVDGDSAGFIVALVCLNGELPTLQAEFIANNFGLTPKESRLALGLSQGRSLEDLAELHHVSKHTLRAQLKSILKKTGQNSQAGLVRLLLQDPRVMFVLSGELES